MKNLHFLLFAIIVISGCRKGSNPEPNEPDGPVTRISGIVREAGSGIPVSGASIILGDLKRSAGTIEFRRIISTQSNEKGEFALDYRGPVQTLGIDVKKTGYFMHSRPFNFYDIRLHEHNELVAEMDKAAVLHVHFKNIEKTVEFLITEIRAWNSSFLDGRHMSDIYMDGLNIDQIFSCYVTANDSVALVGIRSKPSPITQIKDTFVRTLPGQEYDIKFEY